MKLGRLNHVGVATPSIARSLEHYRALFGAEPHGAPFDLPAQGVRVCFVDAPNSQVELKPGGLHIMLIGLKEELKEGDVINLTLEFEVSEDIPVEAEVKMP